MNRSPARAENFKRTALGRAAAKRASDMPVIEIDGLPYICIEWLERRIYRDEVRAKRWRQEARRMTKRTDSDGISLHMAYLCHALQASYRAEQWRRNLTLTLNALEKRQTRSPDKRRRIFDKHQRDEVGDKN